MVRGHWLTRPQARLVPPPADIALAALLCVAWSIEVLGNDPRPAPLAATLVAGWAVIATVAWRQVAPVAAVAAHGLLMGAAAALGTGVFKGPHNVEGVALAVLLYSVGAHRQGPALVLGALLGGAVVSAHAAIVGQPFGSGAVIALVVFVGVTMLTGRAMRQRRLLTQELEARAVLLRSQREARARTVADQERKRIARELHDVVTHVLGEMVVQASSLSRAGRPAGDERGQALGEIERSGREALAELRRLLGVLRSGDPQPLAPAPTVEQVHRLVADTRAQGLPVELQIEGRPATLPPGVEVSAYRVIEEGLAGLRACAARRARVTIRYGATETEIEVSGEPGAAASTERDEARSRLDAIRERVLICGGDLRSSNGTAGDLFLSARLPYSSHLHPPGEQSGAATTSAPEISPPGQRGRGKRAVADVALSFGLFGALTLDGVSGGGLRGGALLNVLAFALIASIFVWRRRAPVAAAVTFAAVLIVLTSFLTPVPTLQTALVALVCITYATATTTAGLRAVVAFVVLGLGVLGVMLVYGIDELASRQVYELVTLALLAWVAGRAMRSRALLNRALEEKARALAREHDERARAAAAQVRRQVARDLHDVVAHGLTVMIVQAGAARRIAASDPDEAVAAAELIEATGREALGEMRRLLEVMSDEALEAPRAAPPGIESLQTLLERGRAAGLAIKLRRDGLPRPLPAGVDLAAYRVVQEALTNTIKHAGASQAELVVRYRDDELELLVADDGHGPRQPVNGDGHGLVGMRERVVVYGGQLEAGGGDDGGFRVRASFPLEAA